MFVLAMGQNGAWLLKWDPWKNRPNPITTIGRRNKISNQRGEHTPHEKTIPLAEKCHATFELGVFERVGMIAAGRREPVNQILIVYTIHTHTH